METIIKSEIFKDNVYHKKFTKDFLSEYLIEKSISVQTPHISGIIKELQLDGVFIFCQWLNAPLGYHFDVENNFKTFNLHFEISGNYSCFSQGGAEPIMEIPQNHYNLIYFPKIKGHFECQGSPRCTLELFFTLKFVKKIAGENYGAVLERVSSAIKTGEPFVFWDQPRTISHEISQTLQEIIKCTHTGQLKQTFLQSKITSLLVEILVEANKKPLEVPQFKLPKPDLENLQRVEGYIKSHLNEALSIKLLATIAGFNESKLKNDFKGVYGNTIFKYITSLRMDKARFLLREENLSIAQVAYEVGYTNPQHFAKAFKRTMGYLPSQLKK